jgi:dolichol-phosphate mannosyltransferase
MDAFISIVYVLHHPEDRRMLPRVLASLYPVVSERFADFEFIIVDNLPELEARSLVEPLPTAIRDNLFLLKLAGRVPVNNAILAGLDRANGDYTLIFERAFAQCPEVIQALYERACEGFDIVYLRAPRRAASPSSRGLHRLFYWIIRRYSDLRVDELAHGTRLISRRALNSLLRLRENLRFMKAIYSLVGYRTSALPTDVPLQREESFAERFRTSLVAITSYTSFLRSLLFWIFVFSLVFLAGIIGNALLVRFTGYDIFGIPQEAVAGWTFLVVLIAIFFAVTCLNLYIMSIYLSNIYSEIKQRPLYIVESFERF